jgi:hypothetical protein
MIGGLWKSAGTAALVAAAGLFVGGVAMPSAKAADLGGDCCADLEERVAELEATTARKGNRRMSLTVSGQVNRSILYWSGGEPPVGADDSGVYAGLDNHNNSTRFIFSGSAAISPNLKAGFEFMTEWSSGARTSQVDQTTPDGAISGTDPLAPATFRNHDGFLNVRTANWYLEDKNLGRITVGRLNVGGPVGTIDLGGVSLVAHYSPGLVGGAFFVAPGLRLGAVVGPTYGGDRIEGIRYDSPNLGGFVVQGTWGEDDLWAASVRYAGEFGGFRVAAGIGYFEQDGTVFQPIQLDTGSRATDNEWSGSLAVQHVASGLFAQGHYAESEFFNGENGNIWLVQAGISKNWWGMGNTAFYGEYGRAEDQVRIGCPAGACALGSEVDFYGVGVVQNIDAAAMELYLGWRRFETDATDLLGTQFDSDLDLVHGGARIRF